MPSIDPEHTRRGPTLERDPRWEHAPRQPAVRFSASALPAAVDLRPHCPPVVSQGQTDSCTANALAAAYGYLLGRGAGHPIVASRLFIYWNERAIEHATAKDGGAVISDGVKALERWGACLEATWPFEPRRVETKPSDAAYAEAKGLEVDAAATIGLTLHAMRHCLAEGYPFVFGLEVGDFIPDHEGMLARPTSARGVGYHALACVGYDDAREAFLVRNSWGARWGLGGYGWVPYAWMTDPKACGDLWCLRRASDADFSVVKGAPR